MDNEQILKIMIERFDKIDQQFNEVFQRLDRIERNQQEDIKGTLTLISKKIDAATYEPEYVSGRAGKHVLR